jgi:transposase
MEKWIERLRIIDLATFNAAQERLANYKGRGGRRRKNATDDLPPDILKGLLFCEKHNCVLTANSRFMECRQCTDDATEGALYSKMNREIALALVCSKVAELVHADASFVRMVKQCVGEEVAKLQAPDPSALNALDAEYAALSQKIEFLTDAPAETKQDQREQHARLADLQRKRGLVQGRRQERQKAVAAPMQTPTDEQVEQEIHRIGEIMTAAGQGFKDAALMSEARQIVHMVTGGRITMTQAGERKAKRGWLQGSFKPHVIAPFFAVTGDCTQAAACPASTHTVIIEFRGLPEIESLSEQVMTRVDEGLMMAEIALKLGLHRSRISLAIRHWHESGGLPVPDGRNRRARLSKKHLVQPLYQSIADEAVRLVNGGLKLGEVARRLNVDRNTITQSVRWWHEQHGVPLPPAQGRRKKPPQGDTPPGGEGLNAA